MDHLSSFNFVDVISINSILRKMGKVKLSISGVLY